MREASKRKEPLVTIEWNTQTIAQRVFIQAVVMPELESVLASYAKDLIELAESEEE